MPQQTLCRKFIVSGRVQGVWFRASTAQEAERRGLTGYAINLPNGDVEVLACGPESALAELETWLADGPRLAEVQRLARSDLPFEPREGFVTG